jgi:hypothetical protein
MVSGASRFKFPGACLGWVSPRGAGRVFAGDVIAERSEEAIQVKHEILDCFAFGSL